MNGSRAASRRRLACAGILGTLALAYFALSLGHGIELHDEGYFLALSRRVAEGEVPSRDFVDIYGPGVYLLNGSILRWSGMRVIALRWSIAIVKALAVACVFLASSEVAPAGLAVGASLLATAALGREMWNLNTPYAALYVILLGLVSLVCALRAQRERRTGFYLLAGLAAGLSILFKQSLAAMQCLALGLMVLTSMLLDSGPSQSPVARRLLVAGFIVVLGASFVAHQWPFGFVGPTGYLLFFAPAHAMGVLVVVAALRNPARAANGPGLTRLWALAAGATLAPALAVGLYLLWGGLGGMLSHLITGPSLYAGYAQPVSLPSAGLAAWFAAALCASGAGIALLEVRPARALAFAALATAALWATLSTGELAARAARIVYAGDFFAGIVAPACAYGLVAGCGWHLLRDRERPVWLVPTLYVFFSLHATGFQIFPRASYNVYLALGAFMPGLAALLAVAWRAIGADCLLGWRRRVATGLLLLPWTWPVVPAVASVSSPSARQAGSVALPFPEMRGISISPLVERDIAGLAPIVEYLKSQPVDRPIFLMNNDWMLLFLSGRVSIFRGSELLFYLMNWGMLADAPLRQVRVDELIARLASQPQTLIITKTDSSTANIRRDLPALARFIDATFSQERAFGPYRVLSRAPSGG